MANEEQLARLKSGVAEWNVWMDEHPEEDVDLYQADLSAADLTGVNLGAADLSEADLSGATLSETDLSGTDLSGAILSGANLSHANLSGSDVSWVNLGEANLRGANLSGANLSGTNLRGADLRGAILRGADLRGTALVRTKLENADLTACQIYGISVWDIAVDSGTQQTDLVITPDDQPTITVDNLEVAQFIYLLLNNQRIRDVIETIGKKAVLILGRFTPERKQVLDALREELRKRNYLPILFDFDKPASRDLTETILTLAGMARFVVADLTDAKSLPQELMAIVPSLPSVPVQPLLLTGAEVYAMFERFPRYPWVLPIYEYESTETLLDALPLQVIAPAETKAAELQGRK